MKWLHALRNKRLVRSEEVVIPASKRPEFIRALDPLSVRHATEVLITVIEKSRRPLSQTAVLFGIALVIIGSINFVPYDRAIAATKTWTSKAEFDVWTHSNTQSTVVGNNSAITLAWGGSGASVTTMSESLTQAFYGSSVAWDANSNVAYVFGGNGTNGNLIHKYTPSTHTVTTAGLPLLPQKLSFTSAVYDTQSDVFYIFGGYVFGGSAAATIYKFDPTGLTIVNQATGNPSAVLPSDRAETSAVWNPSTNKAYVFGGWPANDDVIEYDPNNVGTPVVTKTAVFPDQRWATSAVWDSDNSVAYIFGGSGYSEIFQYNPATNTMTNKTILPRKTGYASAVYNPVEKAAYIFGGTNGSSASYFIWAYYPATNSVKQITDPPPVGNLLSLPTARTETSAFWAPDVGKAYIVGGVDSVDWLDDIAEFNPGTGSYVSSGTAKIVYTPSAGGIFDWESITVDSAANTETITVRYTTNTNCSTGLTTNLSELANSESICVRADFTSASTTKSSSLNEVVLSYTQVGGTFTKTWDTTAEFGSWTKSGSESDDGSLKLTPSGYSDVTTAQASLTFDSVIADKNTGDLTSAVWDTVGKKAYIFGGKTDTGTSNRIVAYNPSNQTVSSVSNSFSSARSETSAAWDPRDRPTDGCDDGCAYIFGGVNGSGVRTNQIAQFNPSTGTVTAKTAVLPSARSSTSAIFNPDNNKFYIFGGTTNGSAALNTILEYDPSADSLVTKSAVLSTARFKTSAVWDPTNNRAYIAGGQDGSGVQYNQILSYNPAGDSIAVKSGTLPYRLINTSAVWSTATNRMIVFGGRSGDITLDTQNYGDTIILYNPASDTTALASSVLPSERNDTSAVWNPDSNEAYIFGGYNGADRTFFGTIVVYKPSTNVVISRALPDRVFFAASVWDAANRKAYIIGGQGGSDNNASRRITQYDPKTGQIQVVGYMPTPLWGGAAFLNPNTGKIYYLGGRNSTGCCTEQIWEFDPSTLAVTVKNAQLPSQRAFMSAAWDPITNKAYLFGGSGLSNQILSYDPAAADTTVAAIAIKTATLPTARQDTAAVYSTTTNKIYVIGGLTGGGVTNQILEYNPSTDTLRTNTDGLATLATAVSGVSAAWDPASKAVYILGGSVNGSDCSATCLNSVQYYDPGTGPSDDSITTAAATLPTRFAFASAIWDAGFSFGGLGQTRGYMEDIFEFNRPPIYTPTSSSEVCIEPVDGVLVDWTSSTYTTTLNGQTVTIVYSISPDFTGAVPDITQLPNSETICIKVTLTTTDTSESPTLDSLSVSYTVPEVTTPTSESSPAPTTSTSTSPVLPLAGDEAWWINYLIPFRHLSFTVGLWSIVIGLLMRLRWQKLF